MTARYFFFLLLSAACTAFSGERSGPVADLQPELKQALVRDDSCVNTANQSKPTGQLQSPVITQEILAAGRGAIVIARPQDECHCSNGNCSTFVYIRSGGDYKLALEESFASLHPMKVIKHGLPSLSGRFQVSQVRQETTIYDWTGSDYQPSLCATVTQQGHGHLPMISRHPCRKPTQGADGSRFQTNPVHFSPPE